MIQDDEPSAVVICIIQSSWWSLNEILWFQNSRGDQSCCWIWIGIIKQLWQRLLEWRMGCYEMWMAFLDMSENSLKRRNNLRQDLLHYTMYCWKYDAYAWRFEDIRWNMATFIWIDQESFDDLPPPLHPWRHLLDMSEDCVKGRHNLRQGVWHYTMYCWKYDAYAWRFDDLWWNMATFIWINQENFDDLTPSPPHAEIF